MATALAPSHRLRYWLQAEKTELWVAVIYSIAIGLLSLVVPVAVQSLVNTVAFGTLMQPLVILTLAVLSGLGFSAVLQTMRTYVVELIQRRVFVRIAGESAHRLLRVRVEAFDQHHGPELVNRFFDVVTLQKAGAILLIDGLSIFMQTMVGMILLGIYHPWLLAFDLLLLLAIAFVWFPLGRGAVPTAIAESKAKYELAAWLEEIALFPVTFKSTAGTAMALERTNTLVTEYLSYRGKHFRILIRQVAGSLALQAIASSVLLGAGGLLVIQRQLTLGQLIAAELVVTLVVSGFGKFGKQLETYYDLCAAVDKLGYLTDLPLEHQGQEPLPAGGGASVSVRGVSFAYGGRHRVFDSLNCSVEPGERVAITGRGKTTLFELLYGLREPGSGVIEIDRIDMRELDRLAMRRKVALVRGGEIFSGTVAANLRLGDESVSAAQMNAALEQVGLLGTIQGMPQGLQTMLTTGGSQFSRGEALRLTLARAMLTNPGLLLVDECLDGIEDEALRSSLLAALFDARRQWTVLIATRDASIAGRCERILDLERTT